MQVLSRSQPCPRGFSSELPEGLPVPCTAVPAGAASLVEPCRFAIRDGSWRGRGGRCGSRSGRGRSSRTVRLLPRCAREASLAKGLTSYM
jgi:hypothetical protein